VTQLAEVITSLTHVLYEERRDGTADGGDGSWKWEARSQRFRSAYLGHGLHLLEGIIQTFKDEMLARPSPGGEQPEADSASDDGLPEPSDVTGQ
jgi:hypothetical protein